VSEAVHPAYLRHELSSIVYGTGPEPDDPAEAYHEASKLSPAFAGIPGPGRAAFEASPELQSLLARCVKRYPQHPRVVLPPPEELALSLDDSIARRRSTLGGAKPLTLEALSTLLHAAYGTIGPDGGGRTVPSAGGLYPLELYAFVAGVEGVAAGLYHFDPLRHSLERLRPAAVTRSEFFQPQAARSQALVAVSAMLWRTRFKYGLRGYRYALLEAGHVVQNLLLASAALDVSALPLGGFYDRRLERLLRIDGVNESLVYCVALGEERRAADGGPP
jgi:SagB-type dehydrogenase family enzyme